MTHEEYGAACRDGERARCDSEASLLRLEIAGLAATVDHLRWVISLQDSQIEWLNSELKAERAALAELRAA